MPARKCCFDQMSRVRVPKKYLFSVKLLMFLSFNVLKISRKKPNVIFRNFNFIQNQPSKFWQFFYDILTWKLFNWIILLSVEKDKKIFGSSTSNRTRGLLKKWKMIFLAFMLRFNAVHWIVQFPPLANRKFYW